MIKIIVLAILVLGAIVFFRIAPRILKNRKSAVVDKKLMAKLEIELGDEATKARDLADDRIKKRKITKLAELYALDEIEKEG